MSVMVFAAPESRADVFPPTTPTTPNDTPQAPTVTLLTGMVQNLGDTDTSSQTQEILMKTLERMLNNSQATAISIGNSIMTHTKSVFNSIIWMVLAAEITFVGFRIMLRTSVLQVVTDLVVTSFVLAVVIGLVGTQPPLKLIETGMYQLTSAGRNMGATIIQNSLGVGSTNETLQNIAKTVVSTDDPMAAKADQPILSATGNHPAEPAAYWLQWLGVQNAYSTTADLTKEDSQTIWTNTTHAVDPKTEYKFSQNSLMDRIWGIQDTSKLSKEKGGGADWGRAITSTATSMMIAMTPFRMLGQCLTVSTIQTGAILAPVFQQVGVFVGSLMTFYVVAALGVATLPLVYFKNFRKLWSSYLTVLGGIALIPCFYYIFSAIGFVFAANTFEALFPLQSQSGGNQSLAVILNTVFMKTLIVTMADAFHMGKLDESGFGSAIGQTLIDVMNWTFTWSLYLGRISFASGIVAAIVTSGTSFAMLGGQVAYRWSSGFGGEGLTDRVSEFFSSLQGSIGSGLSAMYSNYVNRASEAAGAAGRGAGGG